MLAVVTGIHYLYPNEFSKKVAGKVNLFRAVFVVHKGFDWKGSLDVLLVIVLNTYSSMIY